MVDSSDFHPASPVPSDKFLWAGEKPFTAFGQFGEGSLDHRVFNQDTWWVNINGEAFLLTEMTTDYLTNVLGFLFQGQERFYSKDVVGYAIDKTLTTVFQGFIDVAGLGENFVPNDWLGYTEFIDNLPNPIEQYSSPAEWLSNTPLVKKIINILESREQTIS